MNDLEDFINEDMDDDEYEGTPLTRALRSERCSIDDVKLLLDDGETDVNSWNEKDGSPLITALCSSKEDAIIKLLIQKGAKCNVELDGRNSLCYALSYGASKDVIRLLLEAGCDPKCNLHLSVLECATEYYPIKGVQQGVLELLIKAGADLHSFKYISPICCAFMVFSEASDFQLLMKEGIKLDSCLYHDSPWFCAANKFNRLRTYLVELLVNSNMSLDVVDGHGWSPLECALGHCIYETAAIKLMLDRVAVSNEDTLLHAALGNDHCKLSVVKLLLKRGFKVDELDSCNLTPLHHAVMCSSGEQLSIIELLLEKGSPVNAVNMEGYTPLKQAVELEKDCDVIQALLAAGACVDHLCNYKSYESFEVLKMLAKYTILQKRVNISRMNTVIKEFNDCDKRLDSFAKECVLEVQKLGSKMIFPGYSVRDFVHGHSALNCRFEARHHDFNRFLRMMDNTDFPILFDVVSAKLGKTLLATKLEEYGVYAMNDSEDAKTIILDSLSLSRIITYLSHADMLRMLIAYVC